MPNWCEGSLKIRGTKGNIKRFLQDGVESAHGEKLVVEWKGQDVKIENSADYIYIKGTKSHFLDKGSDYGLENYLYRLTDGRFCISFPNFSAAWNIDAKSLADISKEYGIDFKIFAFECGCEFNRDILILDGVIEKDFTIRYDDYVWDCVCPEIGG